MSKKRKHSKSAQPKAQQPVPSAAVEAAAPAPSLATPESAAMNLPTVEQAIILIVSISLAVFYLHKTCSYMSQFVITSDETYNYFALKSLDSAGIPYQRPPTDSINFEQDFRYPIYRQHLFDLYLRYPFYKLSKNFDYDWIRVSNLAYFYLAMASVLIGIFVDRKSRIPVVTLAFLFIFFSKSPWASASFHYLRYHAYLMMSVVFSLMLCCYVYVQASFHKIIKIILILIISVIPSFLHQAGYFCILFWIVYLGIAELSRLLGNLVHKRGASRGQVFSSLSAMALITFAMIYKRKMIAVGLSKLHNYEAFVPSIKTFFELNFNTTATGLTITAIVFLAGMLSFKKLSYFERRLFIFVSLFLIFALTLSSFVVGSQYSGYHGRNRYYAFLHPVYLLLLSLMVTAIYNQLAVRLIRFKLSRIAIFMLLLVPFIFDLYKLCDLHIDKYNFSHSPRIRRAELDTVKERIKEYDCVVVTDAVCYFCQYHFPDIKSYMFFGYSKAFDSAQDGSTMRTRYAHIVKHKGRVLRSNGMPHIGTRSAFCEMLAENPSKLIWFFNIDGYRTDEELLKSLKTVPYFGNGAMIPAASLQEKVCR